MTRCACTHENRGDIQTERYLAALCSPTNYRLSLPAHWPRVFDAAAELDKAVEIDAYPDQQDLSTGLVRLAKTAGCRILLGTDSRGPSQLTFIELRLASALLGGSQRERILNFMKREELLAWAASSRTGTFPTMIW